MQTVIFDLDGTLALISKRRDFANAHGKFDWSTFFDPKNINLDDPNWPVIHACRSLAAAGFTIVIFSGRDDISKKETVDWLENYGIISNTLRMRKHGDNTPDQILKKMWLEELFPDKSDILCVFDDRDKVVKMWRAEGLTCFQVAEGKF